MDLSVVVPARNAARTIGGQLDALTAQVFDGPWELIVADNGSRDGTGDIVEGFAARDARVRLVDASAGVGAAYCRNVGIEAARGAALAFCDADDVVAPGWLGAIGEALLGHEFVAGRLDVHELNPAWVAESRGLAIETGPGDFFSLVRFAHSCNLGVRRSVIDRFGGFDERFSVGEDIEFSIRLLRAGIPVTYIPDAVVYYRYRASLRAIFEQARAYGRAQPALLRLLAAEGPSMGTRRAWRSWLWLARHTPNLVSQHRRAEWAHVAGTRLGVLETRCLDLLRRRNA